MGPNISVELGWAGGLGPVQQTLSDASIWVGPRVSSRDGREGRAYFASHGQGNSIADSFCDINFNFKALVIFNVLKEHGYLSAKHDVPQSSRRSAATTKRAPEENDITRQASECGRSQHNNGGHDVHPCSQQLPSGVIRCSMKLRNALSTP
jgi:hypothetical protein